MDFISKWSSKHKSPLRVIPQCILDRYTTHPTNTPNHFLATLTNATPFFPSTTSQPRTSPTDPERRARQVGQSLHRVAVELTVVVVVVVARPAVVVVGVASLMHRQHSSSPLPTPTPRGTVDQRDGVEWSRKTSRNCRSSADQSPPPPSASPETPAKTQTNPWMKLPAETHGTIGVPQSVAFPGGVSATMSNDSTDVKFKFKSE